MRIGKTMARAPGFLGLLLLAAVPLLMPGSPVRAQQTGAVRSDPVGNMTRAQLEAELEVQQSAATNPSYSEELREQAMMEAAMIRRRLEQGDFLVGDDLEVTIVGHPNLSDTYKIGPGSTLLIEGMGEISVAGVLRSEIEGYLQEELERYIRDPVVRARPTIRLSILGAVGNPGFYNLPSTALLSDAIMMAGGPG
ncbi:MAG: polysaccharide biosynthesis/export family protein, partial [Gemmatimonadota bacterium]